MKRKMLVLPVIARISAHRIGRLRGVAPGDYEVASWDAIASAVANPIPLVAAGDDDDPAAWAVSGSVVLLGGGRVRTVEPADLVFAQRAQHLGVFGECAGQPFDRRGARRQWSDRCRNPTSRSVSPTTDGGWRVDALVLERHSAVDFVRLQIHQAGQMLRNMTSIVVLTSSEAGLVV